MRYAFLIYLDEQVSGARSDEEIKAAIDSHAPYIDRLRQNGAYLGSERLAPSSTAQTLRSSSGKPIATEGPFAESREQLGGLYFIEAADLDIAIDTAKQCPALNTVALAIEIRPTPFLAISPSSSSEREDADRHLFTIYREEGQAGEPLVTEFTSYAEHLRTSGRLVSACAMSPSGSATCLRRRHGELVLTDGPFKEGAYQLVGSCIVWARDPKEAAALASESLFARDSDIEVRSILRT